MSDTLLIKNARIIDPESGLDADGGIFVRGGIIESVGDCSGISADTVIDASGLVAAPGFVDMHVHLRDPGFTEKEDIFSACEAAAAGGVTTVCAMPNTSPAADSPETISYILDKSRGAKARVLPVSAVTVGLNGLEAVDFAALKAAGAVAMSDDGKPVATAKLLREAMEAAEWHSMPLLAHCEDTSLSGGGLVNEGVISEALGVKGIPAASEDVGTARELALAASLNKRVHICHVSTAGSVELIRCAKRAGVKVTAETCPHYFALNEELLLHCDADYRMNPPLRTELDRFAVIRGIIDGTIDAIATDHAPHTVAEKSDFFTSPSGVVGLETSLAASITSLVEPGHISLYRLISVMSAAPARILGVNAGTLRLGSPADIVLFDPAEKWTIKPEKLHGKSRNSAFKGMELTGRVRRTLLGGRTVFEA